MPYRYKLPVEVISPKDKVSDVKPIFDNGNFHGAYSVAKLKWNKKDVIGIRWNINEREADKPNKRSGKEICKGEPNSRGYSTWFILPDDFILQLISDKRSNLVMELKEYLNKKNE